MSRARFLHQTSRPCPGIDPRAPADVLTTILRHPSSFIPPFYCLPSSLRLLWAPFPDNQWPNVLPGFWLICQTSVLGQEPGSTAASRRRRRPRCWPTRRARHGGDGDSETRGARPSRGVAHTKTRRVKNDVLLLMRATPSIGAQTSQTLGNDAVASARRQNMSCSHALWTLPVATLRWWSVMQRSQAMLRNPIRRRSKHSYREKVPACNDYRFSNRRHGL